MDNLKLININKESLIQYIYCQINNLFPANNDNVKLLVNSYIDEALYRTQICVNSIKYWPIGEFNYLHSTQYCQFLYFLSNTIWKRSKETDIPTKLFLLNKALNGIDLFYEVEMPSKFFIGHSVGIVLGKATYSDYFVIYQNSTVGKNHGVAPTIQEGVIMYPNTAVVGNSNIGKGTVLSQGTSLINTNTPGHSIVYNTNGKKIEQKPIKRNILIDIFRV